MAITIDDFSKIWASTSPLTPYEFSEDNYKSGWNFVGGTPPSRQMWDFLQKNNDEKMQYLANNYLPLSGGTINGELTLNTSSGTRLLHLYQNGSAFATLGVTGGANAQGISLLSKDGSFSDSYLSLSPSNKSTDPNFVLAAGNGTTTKDLVGRPDGTLTWDDKPVMEQAYGLQLSSISGQNTYTFNARANGAVIFAKRDNKCSCHMVDHWEAGSVKIFSTDVDPITVTKAASSSRVTITNVNSSAVVIRIINCNNLL